MEKGRPEKLKQPLSSRPDHCRCPIRRGAKARGCCLVAKIWPEKLGMLENLGEFESSVLDCGRRDPLTFRGRQFGADLGQVRRILAYR